MEPQVSEAAPRRIEPVFRNGTIGAVGVLLGFSLTFMTTWAAIPGAWSLLDLVGLLPLIAGTGCQLYALTILLRPDSLELPRYNRAVRSFVIGVVLVTAGGALALGVDAIGLTHGSPS